MEAVMPLAPVVPPDAEQIDAAVTLLRGGGIVVFPTDTVYGVGAMPGDEKAVQKIFRAKQRPPEKALPVLIADVDDLTRVAAAVPPAARRLAKAFWPGPLTLVLRRAPGFRGAGLAEDETVAIRIPNHEVARAVIRGAGGALAVTSANRSGAPSPPTAREAAAQIGRGVDLIIDGGPCPGGVESSIVDCSRTPIHLIREGALTRDQLTRAALTRIG
jgi:L-threonylcarbamoyladenylate synthase